MKNRHQKSWKFYPTCTLFTSITRHNLGTQSTHASANSVKVCSKYGWIVMLKIHDWCLNFFLKKCLWNINKRPVHCYKSMPRLCKMEPYFPTNCYESAACFFHSGCHTKIRLHFFSRRWQHFPLCNTSQTASQHYITSITLQQVSCPFGLTLTTVSAFFSYKFIHLIKTGRQPKLCIDTKNCLIQIMF